MRLLSLSSVAKSKASRSTASSNDSPSLTPIGEDSFSLRDSLPILVPMATHAQLVDPAKARAHALTRQDAHVFMGLIMSVIGAGMLSLPFTFAVLPAPLAVVTLVGVGCAMAFTAHALLSAHVAVVAHDYQNHDDDEEDAASFRSMASRAIGPRFAVLVSVVLAVGIFGGCVGVIRIARDMTPHMTELLYELVTNGGSYTSLASSTRRTAETALLWTLFALVVFPLCALRSLQGMRVPCYAAFVISLLLVGVVVYRAASTSSTTHDELTSPIKTDVFPRTAQTVSIYSYAFTMHLNLLPLFAQLRGHRAAASAFSPAACLVSSTRRMTLILAAVTLLCIVLYLAFALCATHLYGAAVQGNVLVNMHRDAFMKLPLVAVFLTVLLSFPPLFHPGRVVVEELLARRPAATLHWTSRVGAAAVLLIAELLVATWVPGIEVVFALVGASTTVLNCYVFPVVMFTTLYPWKSRGFIGRLWCGMLWMVVVFVAAMGVRTVVFLLSNA